MAVHGAGSGSVSTLCFTALCCQRLLCMCDSELDPLCESCSVLSAGRRPPADKGAVSPPRAAASRLATISSMPPLPRPLVLVTPCTLPGRLPLRTCHQQHRSFCSPFLFALPPSVSCFLGHSYSITVCRCLYFFISCVLRVCNRWLLCDVGLGFLQSLHQV